MSWEAMERGSGLLVLILVLEPFLLRFFLNKRGGGGRRGRNIEALDQFSQHRSDPKEQLLAFVDLSPLQTAFATSASKHAAHSVAEPRASSKNFARVRRWRRPFPSAVFSKAERLARLS